MPLNPDWIDLLSALSGEKARFLIVGGQAVIFHSEPRYTKDIDLWVDPAPENAQRVWRALAKFGAALQGLDLAHFSNQRMVVQIGVEPNRVDLLMGMEGVDFERAWKRRVKSAYGPAPVYYIGRTDLIRAKRAAGRVRDLVDLETLGEVQRAARHRKPRRRRR